MHSKIHRLFHNASNTDPPSYQEDPSPPTDSDPDRPRVPAPYVPSLDQQRHIDKLSNSSSPALTSIVSQTQTEYFDLLPSFQMFQAILRRDDSQFSENLSISPPLYAPSLLLPSRLAPGYAAQADLAGTQRNHTSFLPDHPANLNSLPHRDFDPLRVSSPLELVGASPLDNIDKLAKVHNPLLDVQIYVTKRIPEANVPNDLETRLKEYTCGDIVSGYIIISNTSDRPVEFGLFMVSLDGTIKHAERDEAHANGFLELSRYRRIWIKKFVKMYDLNASYGYAHIPNSAGIEYEAYTADASDGCILGLPNERVLAPHTRYKKFFMFKFPDVLLDNACVHRCPAHILPPPSFGVDKTCFFSRGESIQINKLLGYGFLNNRGTPLVTKDYGFSDTSISYTIEAKIIDKTNPQDRGDFSEREINACDHLKDYVISRSNQFFLKFVPKSPKLGLVQDFFGGWGADLASGFRREYQNLETWKMFEYYDKFVEREIEHKICHDSLSKSSELKLKHMSSGPGGEYFRDKDKAPCAYHEDEFMFCTHVPVAVFGRKKKMILSSLIKLGQVVMKVRPPSKPVQYALAKLLMRYNRGGGDNAPLTRVTSMPTPAGTQSLDATLLRPVSTTATDSSIDYNDPGSDTLKSVKVRLHFDPADPTIKPPQISLVDINVVCWSYRSDYPIPFRLGYDFFYTNCRRSNESNNDVAEITRQNLQEIKDKTFGYRKFLKESDIFIARDAYLYLQAVKTLTVKKDTVKEFYQLLTLHTHADLLNSEAAWQMCVKPGTARMEWVREMEVPLHVINRHNINLITSFQNCMIGRSYCLQVIIKFKGSGGEQNEFADNIIKLDVPVVVGET